MKHDNETTFEGMSLLVEFQRDQADEYADLLREASRASLQPPSSEHAIIDDPKTPGCNSVRFIRVLG